jgi:hypothetical protein
MRFLVAGGSPQAVSCRVTTITFPPLFAARTSAVRTKYLAAFAEGRSSMGVWLRNTGEWYGTSSRFARPLGQISERVQVASSEFFCRDDGDHVSQFLLPPREAAVPAEFRIQPEEGKFDPSKSLARVGLETPTVCRHVTFRVVVGEGEPRIQ